MDVFPTFLKAAGGDPSRYELDGLDVLPTVAAGAPPAHERIFWEMGQQTAVREGRWKLVLHGQLVEGAPAEDDVFLADLDTDMGERRNLAGAEPERVAALRAAAEEWRAGIEERWQREWLPRVEGAAAAAVRVRPASVPPWPQSRTRST
jgi:arylsulfatase A-like enzyme